LGQGLGRGLDGGQGLGRAGGEPLGHIGDRVLQDPDLDELDPDEAADDGCDRIAVESPEGDAERAVAPRLLLGASSLVTSMLLNDSVGRKVDARRNLALPERLEVSMAASAPSPLRVGFR